LPNSDTLTNAKTVNVVGCLDSRNIIKW